MAVDKRLLKAAAGVMKQAMGGYRPSACLTWNRKVHEGVKGIRTSNEYSLICIDDVIDGWIESCLEQEFNDEEDT